MRSISLILMFVICSIFIAQAQSQDEKDVAAAVETLRLALIDPTDANLKAITAPELSYGHSNGTIEDQSAFMNRLLSGNSDFKTITLSDQMIKVVDDVAIVRHHLVAETLDSGKPGNPNLSVLLIWKKQKGKWKLLARQATKLS